MTSPRLVKLFGVAGSVSTIHPLRRVFQSDDIRTVAAFSITHHAGEIVKLRHYIAYRLNRMEKQLTLEKILLFECIVIDILKALLVLFDQANQTLETRDHSALPSSAFLADAER